MGMGLSRMVRACREKEMSSFSDETKSYVPGRMQP
jgi:hypothetical protein